jgi:hypothetical protein
MADDTQEPWEPGKGPTLEAAAWHAWENAKEGKSASGGKTGKAKAGKTYKMEFAIETRNPIHSYIATIAPGG